MLWYSRYTSQSKENPMAHALDKHGAQTRLRDAASPVDVVALLSASLPLGWEVEREVDPTGNISIVVLSSIDHPAMPSFILYEKEGQAIVATIRDDIWEKAQTFTSCQRAVASILAATAAASDGTGESNTLGATLARRAGLWASLGFPRSSIDARVVGIDDTPPHGATLP
jgi:hypothetical protein